MNHVNTKKLYKTQWRAYYKTGLGSPKIVYGESETEALSNALAEYRKNKTMVDLWPLNMVVDYVECIG